jgi:Lon protease-like protein
MKIPLFPLEVVLFPEAALPLHIFEDRYKEMIAVCLAEKILETYADGRMDILCQGVKRFEIENLDNSRSFLQAEVDFFADEGLLATRAKREECTALHFEMLELMGGAKAHASVDLDEPIAFRLASASPTDLSFRIELLAMRSDAERTERLIAFYSATLPKLRRGVQASATASRNGHVM